MDAREVLRKLDELANHPRTPTHEAEAARLHAARLRETMSCKPPGDPWGDRVTAERVAELDKWLREVFSEWMAHAFMYGISPSAVVEGPFAHNFRSPQSEVSQHVDTYDAFSFAIKDVVK